MITENNQKTDWIFGIACSEVDGVEFSKFHGTKEQAKRKLFKMIKSDRGFDTEAYDYGTENVDDIEELQNGSVLNAYSCYGNYHIDYTAVDLSTVKEA